MLILTRKESEEVVLTHPETGGELGRVRISSIRGNKVRVAFDFPTSVAIHRSEVYDHPQQQPAAAPITGGSAA